MTDAKEVAFKVWMDRHTVSDDIKPSDGAVMVWGEGFDMGAAISQWTPVAAGLPEKDGTYPVTIDNDHGRWVEYLQFNATDPNKAMRKWMTFYDQKWIVAYMEKPEPYKETK